MVRRHDGARTAVQMLGGDFRRRCTSVTNEKVLTGWTKTAAAALFFNYARRPGLLPANSLSRSSARDGNAVTFSLASADRRRNSGWARMPHCRSPLRDVRATNIWSDG
jgi:hypothetical protein